MAVRLKKLDDMAKRMRELEKLVQQLSLPKRDESEHDG